MAKCVSCGRHLTNQVSIDIGIGSECRRKAKKAGTMGKRGNNWRRRVERTIGFARGEMTIGNSIYKRVNGQWKDEFLSVGKESMEKWLLYHGLIIKPKEVTEEMYGLLMSGRSFEEIVKIGLDKNEEV